MHVGHRRGSDGDAVEIFASWYVWIDHCYLARAYDGLIDVIHASNFVTISNNFFSQHDKVMLFGHNDNNMEDKIMKVTVVYNHFGPGLVQRMPRVRLGYAHVANNRYDEWDMYAIGGSANPTILSEGNYYFASKNPFHKEVTKREVKKGWTNWKWRSSKDVFVGGAYSFRLDGEVRFQVIREHNLSQLLTGLKCLVLLPRLDHYVALTTKHVKRVLI
ncbi:putative pectate lyase [Helianthus annuus]|nr:putative pectate lyase [Helianthus annuus]